MKLRKIVCASLIAITLMAVAKPANAQIVPGATWRCSDLQVFISAWGGYLYNWTYIGQSEVFDMPVYSVYMSVYGFSDAYMECNMH